MTAIFDASSLTIPASRTIVFRRKEESSPYSKPQDRLFVQSNALFLQRLCRWFPTVMSWVNAPPCVKCGCKECEMKTVRGPETEEEKEGGAKRVEGA